MSKIDEILSPITQERILEILKSKGSSLSMEEIIRKIRPEFIYNEGLELHAKSKFQSEIHGITMDRTSIYQNYSGIDKDALISEYNKSILIHFEKSKYGGCRKYLYIE